MPQALTEDLLDILASRYQAAARGYRARIEVDTYIAPDDFSGEPELVQSKSIGGGTTSFGFDNPVTPGNVLVMALANRDELALGPVGSVTGWNHIDAAAIGSPLEASGAGNECNCGHGLLYYRIAQLGDTTWTKDNSAGVEIAEWANIGTTPIASAYARADHQHTANVSTASGAPGQRALVVAAMVTRTKAAGDFTPSGVTNKLPVAGAGVQSIIDGAGTATMLWAISESGSAVTFTGTQSGPYKDSNPHYAMMTGAFEAQATELVTTSYRPLSVALDKSRRIAASQATVVIPIPDDAAVVLSPSSALRTNAQIRIYQWYGDPANEVLTFTGLIDSLKEGRDKRTLTITARDFMKRLIVQTFSATDPQGADEDDAVRTEANGVYLEQDADYIVNDILDRAGWPTADRDIAPTGYALDEYILTDGASWAECIVGENALTGLTGYDAWVDEMGVFHFRQMLANAAPDTDTDPTPDYTYEVSTLASDNLTSRNVVRLDHELDDYDLKTRVKVRGNLATAQAAFTELWHTNDFKKPVGLWWRASDPDFLLVLDRGTKKVYRFRQTKPRQKVGTGIWPLDISGDVAHPLGLSGDPANSGVFWVLEAGWRTGNGNSASIHKYNATTGAHVAEYSLPDGQWTDLKASSSYLWLSRWDTDRIYKRSKTDGSGIDNYPGPTVNGNVQVKPSGIGIDGTTLLLFFYGKARFLLVDESDPTTLDPSTPLLDGNGIIRTAGTKLLGGEMDTATHAHLFACSDDLGIVWKYALTEPSTDEIFSEVIDTDLEDELGFLSGAEDRTHDSHSGDGAHPFEIRRETLTLEKTITNLSQATETALRVLDELAHRREVNDWAAVGHPGHQRGDLHQLTDPVTGIDDLYVIDTYRDNMDARGYLATIAYVPYRPTY